MPSPATIARSTSGSAAVEFAMVVPIFLMLLVGVIDLGGALFVRFRLDAAASSTASYALTKAAEVNAATGNNLAETLAKVARNDAGINAASVVVTVNNGPVATASGSGAVASSGTPAPADQCYCPQAAAFSWGAAATCKAACSGGGIAGKFVRVVISRTYDALFSNYGLIDDGTITVTTMVQTE